MKANIQLENKDYRIDFSKPLDISIPISFATEQIRVFDGPPAEKEDFCSGDFTGNVALGGSCNCEVFKFSPHLNGTHTECVGHISKNNIDILSIKAPSFMAAALITIEPESCNEQRVITEEKIKSALSNINHSCQALIMRTLPNDTAKYKKNYETNNSPYFSEDAISFINQTDFKHLLVDMPSIDRLDNENLTNHRIFWNVAEGICHINEPSDKTITEMIYVTNEIEDGFYLLNLQISAFSSDAAPSRPILYKATLS
jgi:kynurenine formamidase